MQMKFSRLLDVFFSLSVSTFAGTLHVSMLASCEGSNDACGVERGLEGFGMFSGAFVLAQPRLNDEHFYQISKVQSNFFKKLFLAKCRFFLLCQVNGHAIIDMSGETFATSPFTSDPEVIRFSQDTSDTLPQRFIPRRRQGTPHMGTL